MDLEKINKEYLKAKEKLDSIKKEVEDISKKLKKADIEKRKHEISRDEAEMNGDKTQQKLENEEIKRITKEIEEMKEELNDKKKEISNFEIRINLAIDEIKQDPDMKQVMNEALEKRYTRQVDKYKKEKEKVQTEKMNRLVKKSRYENLKKLIAEHPGLGKNLNGILNAEKIIKKLNDELKTLDSKKDFKRIAEIEKEHKVAKDKLDKNKTPFMNYINKNKINIKYEDIKEMAVRGLSLDDAINGLGKEIKGYDKKIKMYDKNINNYSVAIKNIRTEMTPRTAPEITTPGEPSEPQSQDPNLLPQSKPKWWQFRTRFKNWREQRRQAKLSRGDIQDGQQGEPPIQDTQPAERSNTMRNALKYDIVKEIVGYENKSTGEHVFGSVEKEQLRNARRERENIDSEVR